MICSECGHFFQEVSTWSVHRLDTINLSMVIVISQNWHHNDFKLIYYNGLRKFSTLFRFLILSIGTRLAFIPVIQEINAVKWAMRFPCQIFLIWIVSCETCFCIERITKMRALVQKFRNDESGASMVEYGLLVALIAAVLIAVVTSLGTGLQGVFQSIVDSFPAWLAGLTSKTKERGLLITITLFFCFTNFQNFKVNRPNRASD